MWHSLVEEWHNYQCNIWDLSYVGFQGIDGVDVFISIRIIRWQDITLYHWMYHKSTDIIHFVVEFTGVEQRVLTVTDAYWFLFYINRVNIMPQLINFWLIVDILCVSSTVWYISSAVWHVSSAVCVLFILFYRQFGLISLIYFIYSLACWPQWVGRMGSIVEYDILSLARKCTQR